MKLLIITYSYTPDLTPRAFRWAAVATQLAKKGHQVHVLCATSPGAAVAENDGITVYRVRDWLLNASARVKPGAGTSKSAPAGRGRYSLRDIFRHVARAIWRSLHWPDFACGWVIPAARVARSLCRENNYDWIISSSHPFSGHMIGKLARLHTSKPRWLVDISDPYSDMTEPAPNNFRLYAWLNRAVEGGVVAGADAISVTTDSTRKLYEASFPSSAGKIQVVPPLLSLPKYPCPTRKNEDQVIQLVFVGTLYRKLRSPKYLLACVSALSQAIPERRIELHFYGSINDCGEDFSAYPEDLKSIVFVHGLVSRECVVQAMIDSDVLVNIGNDSEAQLASKVVEYMAIGKPILNLVSIVHDSSTAALADYPATLTIMRSEEAPSQEVVEALRSFVLNPKFVDQKFADMVQERFSSESITGLYESMLHARLKP